MSEPLEKTLLVARAVIWESPRKERLLIGQRLQTSKNYKNRWEIPGGKVDAGELPHVSAVREVKEETHLDVIRFPFISFIHHYLMNEPGTEGDGFYGYEITTHAIESQATDPSQLVPQPKEHQALKWATLEEASDLNLMPQSSFVLPYLRDRQRETQRAATYFFALQQQTLRLPSAVGETR